MSHSLKLSIILVTILLAALLPTMALAAPPAQTDPTAPGDLASTVAGFLDLLIALAVGGGIAYLLQMSDTWKQWDAPYKPLVVIALTALVGGGLAALKVVATAELFAGVPDWGRAFVSFIVVFFGSQLTYQRGFTAPSAWNFPKQ